MRRTVWKYTLDYVTGPQAVDIPVGAKFLRGGFTELENGHRRPALWFEVDPAADMEDRWFEVYGTGWDITRDGDTWMASYFGDADHHLVWHIYEVPVDEA